MFFYVESDVLANSRTNFKAHTLETSESEYHKAALFNNTAQQINVEYNLCEHDYNLDTKQQTNFLCSSSSALIASNESIEVDLNYSTTNDPKVIRKKIMYIKKISSNGSYQYFISDQDDGSAYSQYDSQYRTGVRRAAFYCTLINAKEHHIYATSRGFLCR